MMRFLISRLSSLGDVVCSLPAASALKEGFPDSHVTWIVDKRFADIVRCCSAVDEVVLRGALPRGNTFDAAIDLQGLLKSAIEIARVKAKQKVGYHWQREGAALFSRRVIPDPTSLHVVDQYVDVARAIGGVADFAMFRLVPKPEAIESIRPKLPPGPFVVMNPGAAWASKRWPVEQFVSLIESLPCSVVLIGAPGETGAEEIASKSKKPVVNLSGQTSLMELIALISLSRAHVGGDTGSSHLAAALGVSAIGLYSATRPERSCPYGQIDRCHYDPSGLRYIQPQAVLGSVMEALA